MHCHCGTSNRVPARVDIHGPLQTRGETRYPGGVSVSCLASRTPMNACDTTKGIYGGLTLDMTGTI